MGLYIRCFGSVFCLIEISATGFNALSSDVTMEVKKCG